MPQSLKDIDRRIKKVKETIAAMGYVLQGTISRVFLSCGKLQCPCHNDPARKHGPYFYLTRKENGKTLSIKLPTGKIRPYREYVENYARLKRILKRYARLSEKAIAAVHPSPCVRRQDCKERMA